MFIAISLAGEGYCGGDPEKVLAMRADIVVHAMNFEVFKKQFQDAFLELNKAEK
jgi:hypothetical protein